jgi:hypothetical protein
VVANLGSRNEERAGQSPAAARPVFVSTRWCRLHDWRDTDTHDAQRGNEFAADYGHRCQQELFSVFVWLAEDGMAVIESVKELSQLEDVFGEVCGLGCSDALVDDVRGLRGGEPESPEFVGGFAV